VISLFSLAVFTGLWGWVISASDDWYLKTKCDDVGFSRNGTRECRRAEKGTCGKEIAFTLLYSILTQQQSSASNIEVVEKSAFRLEVCSTERAQYYGKKRMRKEKRRLVWSAAQDTEVYG
jgi:hypothetical protein